MLDSNNTFDAITSLFYSTDTWIFDLDGTLVDSHEEIAETLNLVFASFGFKVHDPTEIERLIGLSLDQILNSLNIPCDSRELVSVEFRNRLHKQAYRPCKTFLGVEELLKHLKESGKKVGIATNKPSDLANRIVNNSSFSQHIDVLVGSTNLRPKPYPDILFQVMTKLESGIAVMVGDRPEDFLAAKEAGMKSIDVSGRILGNLEVADNSASNYSIPMNKLANLLIKL